MSAGGRVYMGILKDEVLEFHIPGSIVGYRNNLCEPTLVSQRNNKNDFQIENYPSIVGELWQSKLHYFW